MDKTINVIWYGNPEKSEYHAWWDQSILQDLFNGQLWKDEHEFVQYDGIDSLPEDEGAVVVIPARLWADKEDQVSESLQKLRFVVLICCGNEDNDFDFTKIRHPMLRVWMQLPRMNVHNDVSYKLVNGYRPNTPQLLKEIGHQGRDLDFFFAGQINHERREQCLEAIKGIEDEYHGQYFATTRFTEEAVDQIAYLGFLARTKIAFCPSGIECADSFRLYEALEAGCLPVVDAFSTQHKAPGFWKYLFEENAPSPVETIPFPIIPYWSDLPALMPTLLKEYPANANRVQAFWIRWKRKLYYKLIEDYGVLHG